jgi:hypothetical protein
MSNLNEADQVAIGFIVCGGLTILYAISKRIYNNYYGIEEPIQTIGPFEGDIMEQV